MGERGGLNIVDCFANSVQSGWSPDGHVCHAHVVIDGADKTDDLEEAISLGLFIGNFACIQSRSMSYVTG